MKSEAYKGHLAMLMANVLWGCMSPSSKIVLSSGLINAISLTTFRMLGAAIVFWIASIFTRKEHVPHEDLNTCFSQPSSESYSTKVLISLACRRLHP